jgi:CRP-like cAMP-binding protein
LFAKQLGRVFEDGEIVFEEGSTGRDMYVIQSGEVEIIKGTGDSAFVLAVLGKGEIFGEMALFENLPRSATVRVKGKARILTVDARAFLSKVSSDPTLGFQILREMSQRVRRLDEEVKRLRNKVKELSGEEVDSPT